jgi:predicted transcriptional regulator
MSRAHARKHEEPAPKHPATVAAENAPVDDEPTSEEDLKAIEEGWRAYRNGESVTHDEAARILLGKP